ncbi:MAG TPA: ABC transporter substrate-binding protein [Rhizomicrobium sp.]|jgi:iron complex transport system substrate-binding protein|nr:ABC transporter substrate-binding protein [Rhizomicrobium sp.]
MQLKHGWHVLFLAAAILAVRPATAEPHRVVSINLCTDEYVFRLVPRANIAALSFLAGDKNPIVSTIADQVGGLRRIRQTTEEVLALNPDLVVLDAVTNARVREHLERAHIPLLEVPFAATLADVRKVTAMLGERLQARAKAAALLAQMDRDIATAAKRAPHPRVRALIYEPNGYATGGGVTEELMRRSGLANAAPTLKPTRLGTVPIEAIVASAPELLILAGQPGAQRSRADLILHHPALRALRHTHVEWANTNPLLCPGPWSAQTAVTFADLARKTRALAKQAPAK